MYGSTPIRGSRHTTAAANATQPARRPCIKSVVHKISAIPRMTAILRSSALIGARGSGAAGARNSAGNSHQIIATVMIPFNAASTGNMTHSHSA